MGHREQLGWRMEEHWAGWLGEAKQLCRHRAKLVPTPQPLRFALRKENPSPDASLLAQGWAARCISGGEKPSKTIGMRTFMTCMDLTARRDRCDHPASPAASQHIPPSELCKWLRAGGGRSQASPPLLVAPLFKTLSPSALRGQALSKTRELLGMVGCWRRAWGPPQAAVTSKQPQKARAWGS